MRRALTALAGLAMLQGSVMGPQSVPDGCYDTEVGPWYPLPETQLAPSHYAPPPDSDGDSVYYVIPPRLRLERTASREGPDRHSVVIPEDALQTVHSRRWWSLDADSLSFHLTTGFVGVDAVLFRQGESWEGILQTDSDIAGLLRYARPVRLERVRCSDPPPIPATADRVLPRRVEVQGRSSLELGRPMPDDLVTTLRREGAFTVLHGIDGPFRGADSLTVRVARNGLVSTIELRYSADFDFARLIQSIAERFGAGVSEAPTGSVTWRNRSTELYAAPSPDGRLPHRLWFVDPRQGFE